MGLGLGLGLGLGFRVGVMVRVFRIFSVRIIILFLDGGAIRNSFRKYNNEIESFVITARASGSEFDENSILRGMNVKCQL